jgi:nucleotide-binding universal stress UspA family protein
MPSGQLLIQFIGQSLQEQIWFRQPRNLKKIVGESSDAGLLRANACFAQKAQTLRESPQHTERKLGKHQRNRPEPLARLMLSEELKFGSASCARYTARETSVSRGKIRRRVSLKILLAIDGSTDSDAAVDEVARLPWAPDCEVKVLTVIEMPIIPTIDPPWLVYLDKVEQSFRERAEADIKGAVSKLGMGECKTLRVAGEVIIGTAKQVILDEAEKWGADLIVLGSRGLGALDRFLLGSVSHAVTQHAKCSVEVVRRRSDVSDEKKK